MVTKEYESVKIGKTGKMIITDPSEEYDKSKVLTAGSGTWKPYAVYESGKIVEAGLVSDTNKNPVESSFSHIHPISDSGQLGFFDASFYKKKQSKDEDLAFYEKCCEITSKAEQFAGTIESHGFVAGCDAGEYGVELLTNASGKIVKVKVRFTSDDFSYSNDYSETYDDYDNKWNDFSDDDLADGPLY